MEARDYCQNTSLGQKHIARRATDRCCDVATYTSYTSRTHESYTRFTQVVHKSCTSRTQVVHKSNTDVALDVLQYVPSLLAQWFGRYAMFHIFQTITKTLILVIKKQIDFKTSVTKIPLLPVLSAAVRKVWAGNRKFVSWASISQLDLNGFFAKRDGGRRRAAPIQWTSAYTTPTSVTGVMRHFQRLKIWRSTREHSISAYDTLLGWTLTRQKVNH